AVLGRLEEQWIGCEKTIDGGVVVTDAHPDRAEIRIVGLADVIQRRSQIGVRLTVPEGRSEPRRSVGVGYNRTPRIGGHGYEGPTTNDADKFTADAQRLRQAGRIEIAFLEVSCDWRRARPFHQSLAALVVNEIPLTGTALRRGDLIVGAVRKRQ